MKRGRVRWYNSEQGYGFLQVAEGRDVMIQAAAFEDSEVKLREGDWVSFTPIQGWMGPVAAEARLEVAEDEGTQLAF